MALEGLPVELLLEITSYLELLSDVNALSQTNSSFHTLCDPILYERARARAPEQLEPGGNQGSKIREEGPLEWAAENGNHACLRRLLQSGVSAWSCGPNYDILPPIVTAAKRGDLEMVKTLTNHQPAMINELCLWRLDEHHSDYVATPLAYAIANGHNSVVEFLIENGATTFFPDEAHPSYSDEPYLQSLEQAIIMCRNAFAARLILKKERELYDDGSALVYLPIATLAGFDLFKVIVDTGLLPEFDNKEFWNTILDRAIDAGKLKIVEFLYEQGICVNMDATETCNPHYTSLHEPDNIFSKIGCSWTSRGELTRFFLQKISIDDVVHGSSLHALICTISAAVKLCDEDLLRRLLAADWTTKKPFVEKSQRLRWLEEVCLYPIIDSENTRILNICLDNGVPISWDEYLMGPPPIIFAAQCGKYEIVKTLLEREEIPRHDPEYNGPTYGVASLVKSTLDNLPSLWDEPQERLDQRHKIVQLVMPHGLYGERSTLFYDSIMRYCINIRHAAILETLDEHGWLQIDPEQQWRMYYRLALQKPNPLMIKRFLEAGLDPNYCSGEELDSDHDLPLSFLGDYDNSETGSTAEYPAAVSLLLEYGANLEKRNTASGLTPLFHIVSKPEARKNSTPLVTRVRVLLEKGADPFSSCNGDVTLIEIAVQKNIEIVKALLKFFDKQNVPFEKVKDGIERALQSPLSLKMKSVLSRWYWRKRNQ